MGSPYCDIEMTVCVCVRSVTGIDLFYIARRAPQIYKKYNQVTLSELLFSSVLDINIWYSIVP